MKKLMVCALAFVVLCLATPAMAQYRVETSGSVGWVFSDGVSFDGVLVNGVVYDRADPKDSVGYNFTFGVYATPQAEIEFLWSRQVSQLEVSGPAARVAGDMNVDNYHGNFVYNFGEEDMPVRPFLFIGLGATSYSDVTFPGRTIPGLSKFSWALGTGVKAFASEHVGFKGTARWTPTYIKTEGTGWWCDPWYGCYGIGTPYYSNQFEFSGGIVARF